MPDIKISATGGGEIDCYCAAPDSGPVPGVVIMCTIFGVDEDLRNIVDDLASKGVVAAAPDLFWRGDSGPKDRSEKGRAEASARAADSASLVETNMQDLADTMATLRAMPQCNGRIVVIGLCYGGPFAFLGPARLGCDAGLSFHGTAVQEYLDILPQVGDVPVRLHWGVDDHACPPEDLARVRDAAKDMSNVEIVTYDGVRHGYTAQSNAASWNEAAAADSWASAMKVIDGLR